jgi:hypothetical protein
VVVVVPTDAGVVSFGVLYRYTTMSYFATPGAFIFSIRHAIGVGDIRGKHVHHGLR